MQKLRVIQWTTGKVGKFTLRAILEDPRLELVGVYAHSPEKVGLDAGELCGRAPCGIRATANIEDLVALGADTVIYTPFMADVDQVARLLESGLDVISTNLFVNVGGVNSEAGKTLEAACQRGGSSLYITGVHPGWANSIAVSLGAVCRRVQCVSLFESADCSGYQSPETWLAMGMSMPEPTEEVIGNARAWLTSFADATRRMAEAMAFDLDELRFSVAFAKTSETVDLGWFRMEKDTIGAVRGGWDGIVDGKTVARIRVTWYLTDKLNEGWEFDDDHYHLVVDGDPGIEARIRFVKPDYWGPGEWEILTALPAVNAAFAIQAAPPGIVTLRHAGLLTAPAGVWTGD